VQRPLASVVVGGLASATLLTLFLIPVLYPIFAGGRPAAESVSEA
jgi:cobalt-zinc-cadmium resistance protein CzcA